MKKPQENLVMIAVKVSPSERDAPKRLADDRERSLSFLGRKGVQMLLAEASEEATRGY